MTHAPYDPRYESARATCQSERGWDFKPDADAKPFDPRDQSTRYGWIIVAVCGAVIVLGKLSGVL